jgi:4-amino-4-deoxy-L-arabinose transferase-like glycosyltransferase
MSTRRTVIALLVLAALYAAAVNDSWSVRPDSGYYLALGRSLAEGRGMEFNGRQVWGFPPLVPLLVAGCRLLAGPRLWPVNAAMSLFGLGVAAASAAAFRRLADGLPDRLGCGVAAGAAVIVATSARLFTASTRILTDVPFTFFVVLGVYAFVRARQGHWAWVLAGSLALAAATWTRLPGIVLWVGLVLGLLLDARPPGRLRRLLATAAGAAIVVGAMAAWMLLLRPRSDPGTVDYLRAAQNLDCGMFSAAKWAEVAEALLKVPQALCGALVEQDLPYLSFMPTALALVGLATLARTRQWTVVMPVLIYGAALTALGPDGIGDRYFLPIMPLAAYALVSGVRALAAGAAALRKSSPESPPTIRRPWAVPLAVGCCAIISLPNVAATIYVMRSPHFYHVYERGLWADYVDLGRALEARGRPGTDRVLAPWFTVVHYLSRLETTSEYSPAQAPRSHYASGPPDDFVRAATAGGYRFVVVPPTQDAKDMVTPAWSRAVTAGLKAAEVFRDPPERFGRLMLFERAAPVPGGQSP